MKTIYLQITTVIIVVLLSVFILLPKDHTTTTFIAQQDLFKEYPNEWMYNQRAYPNNFINAEAIKNAIEQSLNIIKNRQGQGTGDWELEGPINTGGRITDVAISPDNDDIL